MNKLDVNIEVFKNDDEQFSTKERKQFVDDLKKWLDSKSLTFSGIITSSK